MTLKPVETYRLYVRVSRFAEWNLWGAYMSADQAHQRAVELEMLHKEWNTKVEHS